MGAFRSAGERDICDSAGVRKAVDRYPHFFWSKHSELEYLDLFDMSSSSFCYLLYEWWIREWHGCGRFLTSIPCEQVTDSYSSRQTLQLLVLPEKSRPRIQ